MTGGSPNTAQSLVALPKKWKINDRPEMCHCMTDKGLSLTGREVVWKAAKAAEEKGFLCRWQIALGLQMAKNVWRVINIIILEQLRVKKKGFYLYLLLFCHSFCRFVQISDLYNYPLVCEELLSTFLLMNFCSIWLSGKVFISTSHLKDNFADI